MKIGYPKVPQNYIWFISSSLLKHIKTSHCAFISNFHTHKHEILACILTISPYQFYHYDIPVAVENHLTPFHSSGATTHFRKNHQTIPNISKHLQTSSNIRNNGSQPHFPKESRWHKHDQCSTQAQPCRVQCPKEPRQGRLDGAHLRETSQVMHQESESTNIEFEWLLTWFTPCFSKQLSWVRLGFRKSLSWGYHQCTGQCRV